MKKYLCLSVICVFLLFSGFAPLSANYIDVTTTELGDIRIYLPTSARLSLNDGLPVNVGGSSVTGYVLDEAGEREYSITLAVYGEAWQYRLTSGGSYTAADLHVTGIDLDSSTAAIDGATVRFDDVDVFLIGLLLLCICIPIVRGSKS